MRDLWLFCVLTYFTGMGCLHVSYEMAVFLDPALLQGLMRMRSASKNVFEVLKF